jgi:hypothetical protein
MTKVSVRRASADDLQSFSSYLDPASADHLVAVASSRNLPAGIGSLKLLDSESCEITNLVIFTPFPRLTVAKAIIGFLLQQATGKMIYALPFAEFTQLHQELGFGDLPDSTVLPIISSQLKARRQTYGKEISLLIKDQRRLG